MNKRTIVLLTLVVALPFFAVSKGNMLRAIRDKDLPVLQRLRALPYASIGSEIVKDNKSGVTRYNREKAFLGYNFYAGGKGRVYLMDMSGEIVHRWNAGIKTGGQTRADFIDADRGTITACRVGAHYIKGLDSNSRAEKSFYIYPWKTHHGVAVLPDGSYVVPLIITAGCIIFGQ